MVIDPEDNLAGRRLHDFRGLKTKKPEFLPAFLIFIFQYVITSG
jgi:hypothetical protein